MNYKLISTTNPNFLDWVGVTGSISFNGAQLRFIREDGYPLTTSMVSSIIIDDTIMSVTTRNSIYVFESV